MDIRDIPGDKETDMATATMDQDVQTERADLARSARNKTRPPHTYADWQKTNGWNVATSDLSDLKQTTDRLDFMGTGTTTSPGTLQVTRTDPATLTTTVIPDWGTNVVYDSVNDSVTLDHQKPDKTSVTLTITRDSSTVPQKLGCNVTVVWFGKSSRRRRGHGHGAIDIGSWTAVEG
jgi:hypothetical protein